MRIPLSSGRKVADPQNRYQQTIFYGHPYLFAGFSFEDAGEAKKKLRKIDRSQKTIF